MANGTIAIKTTESAISTTGTTISLEIPLVIQKRMRVSDAVIASGSALVAPEIVSQEIKIEKPSPTIQKISQLTKLDFALVSFLYGFAGLSFIMGFVKGFPIGLYFWLMGLFSALIATLHRVKD